MHDDVVLTSQIIERGGLRIELLEFHEPGVVGSPSQRRNQLGLTHLCFYVDDVDAAAERMLEHGALVLDDTRANLGTDIVFLMDPDGVRIELMRGAPPTTGERRLTMRDARHSGHRRRRAVPSRRRRGGWPSTSPASTPRCAGAAVPATRTSGSTLACRWERELGRAGFIGLGWPVEHGGRGASLAQQIIWAEEYARAPRRRRA